MTKPSPRATSSGHPASTRRAPIGSSPAPASLSERLWRLLATALVGLAVVGCASGTVTTSTGAVVPAAVVEAQDAVADALAGLSGVQAEAVKVHDSRLATDDPAEHAANRRTLLASHDALVAAWGALGTWKAASTGAAPASVLRPLAPALDALLDLAARYGIVTPEQARAWRALVPRPVACACPRGAPTGCACDTGRVVEIDDDRWYGDLGMRLSDEQLREIDDEPVPRPVQMPGPKPVLNLCPRFAPTWCECDTGSVVRIDAGRWYDGVNYHVRLGPGATLSTAMGAIEVPR